MGSVHLNLSQSSEGSPIQKGMFPDNQQLIDDLNFVMKENLNLKTTLTTYQEEV